MATVTTTGFGSAAVETLARILDERRGGDPLAPAVVVCAGQLVALRLRRALGRRPAGIAGVEVTTGARFVETLAAPTLATEGTRPASELEARAALRAVLAERPGGFGPVADHRTTLDRLSRLADRLTGIEPAVLDRMERVAAGLAADALRVVRAAEDGSGPALADGPVLERALVGLAATPPGRLGPIVVYLPEPRRAVDGRLLAALVERDDCDVIVGLTGVAGIDTAHRDRLRPWGVQLGGGQPVPVSSATRIEVADPGDEVTATLAELTAGAALGEPWEEMAVLYTTADPYLSLLTEQLDAAGLPWSGPGGRPLAATLTGRFVLRLLELARDGLERSAVITWLAGAPVARLAVDGSDPRDPAAAPPGSDDGGAGPSGSPSVPVEVWDRLSRQAGVVDGDHWEPRLADLARRATRAGATADADEALRLAGFVTELRDRLTPDPAPATWQGWLGWLNGLIDRYLAPATDWPAAEVRARRAVGEAVGHLAVLDGYQRSPDLVEVVALVGAELERRPAPARPNGPGLLVAPVDAATGLAFERVAVIGLAEGQYPRTGRDDTLLPDPVRLVAGHLLPDPAAVGDLDVRAVAAALAAGRRAALALSSRGDLRSTRSRTWPRVLDPMVDATTVLDSHHRVLAGHGRPASAGDHDLRSLIATVDGGDPVTSHPLTATDPVLAAVLERSRSRSRGDVGRHTGRVDPTGIDPVDELLSATAIEDYAACPRRYLLRRVLHLGEEDRPERIDEITPLQRGNLVHAVLESFLAEMLADGAVPPPDRPWPPRQRARLGAILAGHVERSRARGLTGGRVNTAILHRRLQREMASFLDTDDQLRAARGSTPVRVEYGFGMDDGDEPGTVALPDGRTMRLRGRVDRVDSTADGGVLVIDYKGGGGSAYRGVDSDPLDGGRRLQLPLYARVVAERLGLEGPRTALYWLTGPGTLKPVDLEDDLDAELDGLVGSALDGIGGGLFPGVPGEMVGWPRLTFDNCRWCEFDRVCPTDRQREWEQVRASVELTPVAPLLLREGAG